MPITYSPEALARREARKAATRERNAAKKAAAQAARQAQWDAQRQQWQAEQQQKRDGFKSSLSEQDWTDLMEALQEPSSEMRGEVEHVTNEWLHSVKQQFEQRGYLSDKQVQPLLKKLRAKRLQAQQAEAWPELKEGDKVKLWCTVLKSEYVKTDFGAMYKISLLTHYGRRCIIKTGREEWHQLALSKKEAGKKVFVHAKIKWIAPDAGGTFVLTSRGAHFGELM